MCLARVPEPPALSDARRAQVYAVVGPANRITPGIHFCVEDDNMAFEAILKEADIPFKSLLWARYATMADAEARLDLERKRKQFDGNTRYFWWGKTG